jgi:outer membrane usher protein
LLALLWLGATIVPIPTLAADADADQTVLLDVQVNGHPIGKIGEFTLRRGRLMARPDELHDLGFRTPDTRHLSSDGLLALSDLHGLTWRIDQNNQALYVTADDRQLLPAMLEPVLRSVSHRVVESGTGTTLNYDITGNYNGGKTSAAGSLDMRAFSRLGVASSGFLAYAGAKQSTGSPQKTLVRLDSTYSFANVDSLRRYSLGDFISGGLAWTRPIHMGGVQIRKDFSVRPDLVTFPLPTVNGSVAVPSTVDILADGRQVLSREVDPGPFEIQQLPVVTGAGTISLTTTNALGQQVHVTQAFYASSELLAPGLQTFAAQAGLVRRSWGSVSNDYGKIAGTAIYRRGLSTKFTIEGSAESTPGTFMTGGGGVAQLGNLGVLNFAAADSVGSSGQGAQLAAGFQRIGRMVSLGFSATRASRTYSDVAAVNGDPFPRKEFNANLGTTLMRFGSTGVAYASLDKDAATQPVGQGLTAAQHAHILSANYSIQIHHMSLFVTGFKDFASQGSAVAQVGLTIPFGRRNSATIGGASDGSGQILAQQSASVIGEWGYQTYLSAGNSDHEFAEAQYKSPVGLFTAGLDRNAGQAAARVESQGALSFVDARLFPSNTIFDSFAIVDTNPLRHVEVLQENRKVGTTGASGRLLVPDMRSFDLNHVTIEATDIPPDATINDATHAVRPQDRSGVVIRFPVKISHGALLTLVDDTGEPLPVGSAAKLRATGELVPVGYDGDAYVQDLGTTNEIEVELPDGRHCTTTFSYHPVTGEIPKIGPLRCKE